LPSPFTPRGALRCLADLRWRRRRVLALRLAGYGYKEITRKLGVTYTNVNRHLSEDGRSSDERRFIMTSSQETKRSPESDRQVSKPAPPLSVALPATPIRPADRVSSPGPPSRRSSPETKPELRRKARSGAVGDHAAAGVA
jgi:hypothetical protein